MITAASAATTPTGMAGNAPPGAVHGSPLAFAV
jgi:hypothetical protein